MPAVGSCRLSIAGDRGIYVDVSAVTTVGRSVSVDDAHFGLLYNGATVASDKGNRFENNGNGATAGAIGTATLS